METFVFNDDNLCLEEISTHVPKARAIIINNQNQIMLSNYAGVYMFPGGKIEKKEDIIETLQRELFEELGI